MQFAFDLPNMKRSYSFCNSHFNNHTFDNKSIELPLGYNILSQLLANNWLGFASRVLTIDYKRLQSTICILRGVYTSVRCFSINYGQSYANDTEKKISTFPFCNCLLTHTSDISIIMFVEMRLIYFMCTSLFKI